MAEIIVKTKSERDIERELEKLIPSYEEVVQAELEVKILEILMEVM